MNLKSGRWRWVILVIGNAFLFSLACLAPVNVPQAVAVDRKSARDTLETAPPAVPVPVIPAIKKDDKRAAKPVNETRADAEEDVDIPIGQVVFRNELDQPPLPCADLTPRRADQLKKLPLDLRVSETLRDFIDELAAVSRARKFHRHVPEGEIAADLLVAEAGGTGRKKPGFIAEKAADEKEVSKDTVNPLGQFFKNVVRPLARPGAKQGGPAPAVGPAVRMKKLPFPAGGRPAAPAVEVQLGQPGQPGRPGARREPGRRRNAADPSVAHDNKKAEWMSQALQQIETKNWKPALDSLQRIVEHPEDALYFRPSRDWVSIRQEAQRLIGTLPSESLDMYRTQYSALAQQLLNRAVQGNDVELLSRVARLYFHTPAGYEATDRLGNVHLDRGEFGLAAQLFHALLDIQAPPAQSRSWRLKALLAFRKAGKKIWADTLWQEIAATLPSTLEIGGRPVDPRKWLEAQGVPAAIVMEPLAEWPVFFGNKQRTGRPVGSQPLLLNRWSQPTTQVEALRQNLESLADDEADKGAPALPGFMPIMVGDKIAFRTFSGVQVVSAATGKLLWKTETDSVVEEMLSQKYDSQQYPYNMRRRMFIQGQVGYQPGHDPQPLSNVVYRNSNFGQLSSDGAHLFVLEDPQVITPRQYGQYYGEDMMLAQQPQSNTLVAYDLTTGRPVWEAGGEDMGEEFQLPLAGHFFFGTPLFDGNELLLVGEQLKTNEIRLFGIDQNTGKLRWSQLIGVSEVGISRDVNRRWWSAPAAVGEGVIVTPTTSNWIVGVDRVTHSLLWGYHFPRRSTGEGMQQEAQAVVQGLPLFHRWYPSPPMISQQRVVFAPQEANILICLDLFTGKELWQIPRADYLAVAGVFDDAVLLIGRGALAAVSLRNGQPLWRTPTSPIVGRGTAVGDRYYLPCSSGELWTISLETGSVVEKLYLGSVNASSDASNNSVLGNLSFYRGMLLSLSSRDLTAFEQHDTLSAQITGRLQQNPHDPWANIRQAEIHLLRREAGPAIAAVNNILPTDVSSDLLPRYRDVTIDALTLAVRADFSRDTPELIQRLEQLSQSPGQRLYFRRLMAERNMSRKQYVEAFDTYLSLVGEPDDVLITSADNSGVKVRLSAWLQGQFRDLWKAMPASQRDDLDKRIRERAAAAANQPLEVQLQFVNLFRDFPAARDLTRKVIEGLVSQSDFVRAERLLTRWRRGEDHALAAEATERLARLMRDFGLPGDAAYYYADLNARWGDVKLPAGKTSAELVSGLRSTGNLPRPATLPDWTDRTPRLDRLGTAYSDQQRHDLSRSGSRMPFFRENQIQVNPADQRLEITRLDDGSTYWSLPLRSRVNQLYGERVTAESSEHQLVVLHQGVLHGLSPIERKVLWTRTLEHRSQAQYYQPQPPPPMQSLSNGSYFARRRNRMYNTGHYQTALSFANSEIVGYQTRRSFTVLDAASGEVVWSTDRLRPSTRILAGPEIVCLIAPDGQTVQLLRAVDGQPVSPGALATAGSPPGTFPSRMLIDLIGDHDLIVATQEGNNTTRVCRFDPFANRNVWSVDLPRSAYYTLLENDWLAILTTDGWYQVLEMETGRLRNIRRIPPDELKNRNELYSVIDYDNLYLVVNNKPNQNFYSYDQSTPSVKASGVIYAFDLETSKQRWRQEVTGQNLLMERIDYLPALVFATRHYEQRKRVGYWAFNLRVLDKKTGKVLFDESSQSQNGFQALWYHPADQAIELRGWSERIRISSLPSPLARMNAEPLLPMFTPSEKEKPAAPKSKDRSESIRSEEH